MLKTRYKTHTINIAACVDYTCAFIQTPRNLIRMLHNENNVLLRHQTIEWRQTCQKILKSRHSGHISP